MTTKNELIKHFENDSDLCEVFMHGDGHDLLGWTVKQEEHYGGEDQGSTYFTVYRFTQGTEEFFLRFDGFYQSHYGTDYETFSEVKPMKKEITVWN
jgi:hypothetical protein